ncbi:hypothetical protein [Streptomyces sp. NPDC048425]|uniref:hypothetical protein n=1 Tax=Streptomyces sp. NPDC048425 TaxID=3365548 RepID=UPI00371B56B9
MSRFFLVRVQDVRALPPDARCTQRTAERGQPGRRQEAGRAAKTALARAVPGHDEEGKVLPHPHHKANCL